MTRDGQDDSGLLVASGLYFSLAEGESGERTRGRFAVVNGPR